VTLEETYDSNVFYRDTNTVDDFITYVSPGINISFGRADRNFVSFDYLLRSAFYAERDDLNTLNHSLGLNGHYQGARISVDGNSRVEFLESILGAGLNFVTVLTARTVYLNRYTVRYNLSEKTSFYATGVHEETDYEEGSTLLDYNTLSGTAGFAYKALPKTDFFGEVYYGQTATDPNAGGVRKGPHSEFVGGFLGANGSFTPKLTGTAKVGYESRWFSDDTDIPSTPVVDLSLTYRFSEKTATSLGYARRTSISVQSGSASYTADVLTARLQQAFGTRGKWNGTLAFSWENDSFDENVFANREDSLYIVIVGIAYQIRLWLRAGLNYDFQTFDSNDPTLATYDLHRVNLTLAVGY
jgi:hypothetical protein